MSKPLLGDFIDKVIEKAVEMEDAAIKASKEEWIKNEVDEAFEKAKKERERNEMLRSREKFFIESSKKQAEKTAEKAKKELEKIKSEQARKDAEKAAKKAKIDEEQRALLEVIERSKKAAEEASMKAAAMIVAEEKAEVDEEVAASKKAADYITVAAVVAAEVAVAREVAKNVVVEQPDKFYDFPSLDNFDEIVINDIRVKQGEGIINLLDDIMLHPNEKVVIGRNYKYNLRCKGLYSVYITNYGTLITTTKEKNTNKSLFIKYFEFVIPSDFITLLNITMCSDIEEYGARTVLNIPLTSTILERLKEQLKRSHVEKHAEDMGPGFD